MEAFHKFINLHKQKAGDGIRLGQRFVNTYIRGSWPQLFYETDEAKAMKMIEEWLLRHHYYDELPRELA